MKILIMCGWASPPWVEGTGLSVFRLAKELSKNNEVIILTKRVSPLTKKVYPEEETIEGIRIIRFPISVTNRQKLKELIQTINPDIINLHSPSIKFGIFASGLSKAPKVWTIPADTTNQDNPLMKFFEKSTRISNSILKFFERTLIKMLDYKAKIGTSNELANTLWLTYIPYGLDTSAFKSKNHNFKNRFVFVGSTEPERGFFLALNAMKNLKEQGYNFEFRVISRPWQLKEYRPTKLSDMFPPDVEAAINKSGLEENIKLYGYAPDMKKLLDETDVIINPLTNRFMGVTQPPIILLESMALEKVVVATKFVGQEDVVNDNKNGFLCEPTVESFTAKLRQVLDNHKRLGNIRKNARKTICDKYDIKKIAKAYTEIFKKIKSD